MTRGGGHNHPAITLSGIGPGYGSETKIVVTGIDPNEVVASFVTTALSLGHNIVFAVAQVAAPPTGPNGARPLDDVPPSERPGASGAREE